MQRKIYGVPAPACAAGDKSVRKLSGDSLENRVVDGTGWQSGSATQCHDLPFSVRVGKCGYGTELSGGAARRRERRIAACPFAPFECRHVGRERRKRVAFIPKTCHP